METPDRIPPPSFVFFGTDDFSVTVLEELKKAGFLPALVVTQPDRPKGRGLVLTPPPAKIWAAENDIEFLQPERLDPDFRFSLSTFHFSLFVVASYGLIIPKAALDIPKHGTLNVHPSLLPKYRGATPIESQILNDDEEMGVTIMLMDEELDHGAIVAQKAFSASVIPTEAGIQVPSALELRKFLAVEGGKLLAEVMPNWIGEKIQAIPQDHTNATYTKKFSKSDGEIDLTDDPYKNFLKTRAFDSSIGTYFFAERGGKKIRVGIRDAAFKDGKLHLLRVVPEGKKEMSYEEFLRGTR